MKIDGGCHCGAITYEAEIDPEKVGICHCSDCQVLSGTAFRIAVPAHEDDFRISGEPRIYIRLGTTGARRAQAFCENCGSPVYATGVDDEVKIYMIRLGSSNQRAELEPRRMIWCRSELSWLGSMGDMQRIEKQ